MFNVFHKPKFVNRAELARTYTREEVVALMAVVAGVVIDGDPITAWKIIGETSEKIIVLVDLGDQFEATWEFYKSEKSPE